MPGLEIVKAPGSAVYARRVIRQALEKQQAWQSTEMAYVVKPSILPKLSAFILELLNGKGLCAEEQWAARMNAGAILPQHVHNVWTAVYYAQDSELVVGGVLCHIPAGHVGMIPPRTLHGLDTPAPPGRYVLIARP